MKKLIQTFQNIFKIEELKKRILYTLGLLLIYRFGSFVVIPGINPNALSSLADQVSGTGLLGLLDIFSGGAFANASIFALGVMPYISASIIMQLVGMVIPYFQRMQREGEEWTPQKVNQWTRYLYHHRAPVARFGLYRQSLPQAPERGIRPRARQLPVQGQHDSGTYRRHHVRHVAREKITDKGLGNGISLIIMVGIIARLPQALLVEFNMRWAEAVGGMVMLVVEIVILYLVFMATISVLQAVRKVPVQYAKRIVGNKQYGGVRQYIPLKLNAANVMPIIFAQAIMFIPMLFGGKVGAAMANYTGFWYNFVFAILVILFTYFYTAIIVNPNMMADELKRNGGFIPGVKPGKETSRYLDTIMTRITLPGSIFLAIVAILPAFASKLGISQQFSLFFGGTSLLILIGVILDTLKQVESYLLLRHYDGLMKTGRVKGRNG